MRFQYSPAPSDDDDHKSNTGETVGSSSRPLTPISDDSITQLQPGLFYEEAEAPQFSPAQAERLSTAMATLAALEVRPEFIIQDENTLATLREAFNTPGLDGRFTSRHGEVRFTQLLSNTINALQAVLTEQRGEVIVKVMRSRLSTANAPLCAEDITADHYKSLIHAFNGMLVRGEDQRPQYENNAQYLIKLDVERAQVTCAKIHLGKLLCLFGIGAIIGFFGAFAHNSDARGEGSEFFYLTGAALILMGITGALLHCRTKSSWEITESLLLLKKLHNENDAQRAIGQFEIVITDQAANPERRPPSPVNLLP